MTAFSPRIFAALAAVFGIGLIAAGPSHAATLMEILKVMPEPFAVFHYEKGGVVNLPEGNQTNNLKDGGRAFVLSGMKLTSIEGISKLSVLDTGKKGYRPLKDLEDVQLFLNGNELEDLPEELATMDNITFLYVYDNKLRAIPPVVARMKGLLGMYFTGNKITEIPAFVYEMRQLRKLQLSKNQIKILAPEIGNLTGIIHFNLSENQIETVPDSISNLIRLRVCDLSDNKIARLPEAFGNVPILYQLRVRNNPISALPAGFAKMTGTIDITGTKIKMEDLSPGLKARIGTEKPAVKPKVINK